VELDAAEIDHPRERRGVVDDREHGRVSAGEADELLAHVFGMRRHALLVKEVAADAVGIAHHVKRPAAKMRERTVRDVEVVADEVALRQAALGEEELVRIRDRHVMAVDAH
jgi:hypothetical protein